MIFLMYTKNTNFRHQNIIDIRNFKKNKTTRKKKKNKLEKIDLSSLQIF